LHLIIAATQKFEKPFLSTDTENMNLKKFSFRKTNPFIE
jgi:hypothetical protein